MDTKAAWIIKFIVALLVIFVIVEVILGLRNLSPKSTQPQANILQSQSGGKIALIADKAKYKVGEDINVSVRIFTGGNSTYGTDLVIGYDPNILEASTSGVIKGSVYTDYPQVSIAKGKIAISGIATGQDFNGLGVFASLSFKAKQQGRTSLVIDYTSGKTTDSNIIEARSGKDILNQVSNLDLIVDSSGSPVSGASCSDRVYTQCTDGSGKSGTYWCSSITDGFSCGLGCFKEKIGKDLGCKVI